MNAHTVISASPGTAELLANTKMKLTANIAVNKFKGILL